MSKVIKMNAKLEEFRTYIEGRKAAVIGVGISNRPLIKWLAGLGCKVTAFDKLSSDDPVMSKTVAELNDACGDYISWSLGEGYLNSLREDFFDIVFKTPKMRLDIPELAACLAKGSVVTTEMELFMDLCPAEIFSITGSDTGASGS